MKLFLHEYGGHACTGQLAGQLAEMGLEVTYVWVAGFPGPKGKWASAAAGTARFRPVPIDIDAPFDKDNLLRRGLQQLDYARRVAALLDREKPDVILSANSPIEVQQALLGAARRCGAAFVYWLQDIHSEAIASAIGKRNAALGRAVGSYYRAAERRLIRASDAVVAIAPAFRELLASPKWRVATNHVTVVENWAPLGPVLAHDNAWAMREMRPGRLRIVYAGTLARKHDPQTLIKLARHVDADIWVFSEGSAAAEIARRASMSVLGNLFVRPWLTPEELPTALASADVLCAIIDAEAGAYSVPSKVLSYLAAGRPILGALPYHNLAAKTVLKAGAGLVSAPGDERALTANASALLGDTELRDELGDSGRRNAERTFDISGIARRFAGILDDAVCRGAPVPRRPVPLMVSTD